MTDRTKWFEVYVAVLGVAVTGILGYGQWRLGLQQNKILKNQAQAAQSRAVDAIEVQVMTLVSPQLGLIGKGSTETERAERVVLAAAEYLTNRYRRTSLAEMAARISEASPAVSAPTRARLEEARQAPPDSPTYFTVLASLPPDDLDAAREVAKEKVSVARQFGLDKPVQIYKTKLSNNYAIVIGGPLNEAAARGLAATARSTGLAHDSFHQIDKEWEFVEEVISP